MLNKLYREITEQKNVKENLSLLRSGIKEPREREKLRALAGGGEALTGLLQSEEPKVRKNAALLLGDLALQQAKEPLFEAYNKETTLFVKSAYLLALEKIGAPEKLNFFRQRLEELTEKPPKEEEKKHISAEIRELEQIIIGIEGVKKHTFVGFSRAHEFLLTASKEQRDVTLREVSEVSMSVRRKTALHPLGVLVCAKEILSFARLRTYRELLFPIHTKEKTGAGASPESAALGVWESDLPALLAEWHEEGAPFFFRLEVKSRMELDKKSRFAKRFAAELERLSGRSLINSTTDYEVEIRLVETKDGGFVPFFKLLTIRMRRFAYRKNALPVSIHPATAAALVRLARPYLKEDARVLDPFCGVGTMLIEREYLVPAGERHGVDLYGEAVEMARENASAAGVQAQFVRKDYFEYHNSRRFDEIITDMPVRGKKTKEETDAFYARFFEKTKTLLKDDGVILMYSNEEGFVKKHLRLQTGYRLREEYCIRERDRACLFVIGYHREDGPREKETER